MAGGGGGVTVYVLIDEWGEYADYSMTIRGVFASADLAKAAKPSLPWEPDGDERWKATVHAQKHGASTGGCFQCISVWSIEAWDLENVPRKAGGNT